jgi:hypothetical protein
VSTYQAGVSGPSNSANIDTNIRRSTPSTNFGSDASLYIGVTNGATKAFRTFIAFNLSDLPANAVVTSCRLTVTVAQRTNPTPGHVRRVCGEHWLDGNGQSESQATWNSWKTGSAWGVAGASSTAACNAGGDYTTTGQVAYTPPGGTGLFTFPDLSVLCQDALANRGGQLRLRITQDSEATQSNLLRLHSSDATTPTNRPKLEVIWSSSGSTTTSTTVPTTSTTSTSTPTTTTSTTTSTLGPVTTTTSTSTSTPSTSTTTTTSTPTTTSTTTSTLPSGLGGTNTYQAGVSGPANSANIDTYVRLSTPSSNWGAELDAYVGVTNEATKVFRTIMAFNLDDIPPGAVITNCRLTVNIIQRTNPTAGHVRRLCGEHWLDGSGQSESQATWSNWRTGTPWGAAGASSTASCSAGGDYTTTNEVPYTPPAGTGLFTFPNLATLCQDAVALRGGWLRLRISQNSEAAPSNLIKFETSDAATPSNRPKLVVTWSLP